MAEVYDMRKPGESFCKDCPDHEGCMSGIPCSLVRRVNDIKGEGMSDPVANSEIRAREAQLGAMIDDIDTRLKETKASLEGGRSPVHDALRVIIPMVEEQAKVLRGLVELATARDRAS